MQLAHFVRATFVLDAIQDFPLCAPHQVAEMKRHVASRRQELIELRHGYDSDEESHYVVDSRTGEVVLSVKQVVQ